MKSGIFVLIVVALAATTWGSSAVSGPSADAQVATDPVLVGAGDIVRCSATRDEATANLLDNIPGTVFTTGDNAYESGTSEEFNNCYGPSWGRHKARSMPAVGNHEYKTANASGYFGYFGEAAGAPDEGYYSYDRGEWHLIVLNSMCEKVGGCDATSPMVAWLKDDLAANQSACTLAYFHHPLFTSGSNHGNDPRMKPIWRALYASGTDVVLNGHSHNYERFGPQNPDGVADTAHGIREFVVGTGGGAYHGFGTIQPNSEARGSSIDGVLKLTLHQGDYDWEFVPRAGQTFTDSGSAQCHDAPPSASIDTMPPAVQPPQQGLTMGAALGTTTIPTKLTWAATDDQSGIAGYELQQSVNGGAFARVGLASATSTAKTLQLNPGSTYQFRVRATDGADNTSAWSTGPAFTVETQQEDSAEILYEGSWAQQGSTSAYGGALRYANTKSSAAQLTFTGRNVAWVSTRGPNMGRATISVDGVVVKTVDLYSSTTLPRSMIFSRVFDQSTSGSPESHTIRVQALGTKNSASSGTRVEVDAFVVLR